MVESVTALPEQTVFIGADEEGAGVTSEIKGKGFGMGLMVSVLFKVALEHPPVPVTV
jgi:hypothetical protein